MRSRRRFKGIFNTFKIATATGFKLVAKCFNTEKYVKICAIFTTNIEKKLKKFEKIEQLSSRPRIIYGKKIIQ